MYAFNNLHVSRDRTVNHSCRSELLFRVWIDMSEGLIGEMREPPDLYFVSPQCWVAGCMLPNPIDRRGQRACACSQRLGRDVEVRREMLEYPTHSCRYFSCLGRCATASNDTNSFVRYPVSLSQLIQQEGNFQGIQPNHQLASRPYLESFPSAFYYIRKALLRIF